MQTPSDRRSRKRLATRQHISDVATRLFWDHGFDAVTVDQIAAAADVGRMTVFNYFPRKEDLFFDRYDEGQALLKATLQQRSPDISPTESLRQLAHRLVGEQAPYVQFSENSSRFIETIQASPALKARARAIRDELAVVIGQTLAECAQQAPSDPTAELLGHLILAACSVAFINAHRRFQQNQDATQAAQTFLQMIDYGFQAVDAAATDTVYA